MLFYSYINKSINIIYGKFFKLFLLTSYATTFVLFERKFENINKPFLTTAIFISTAVGYEIRYNYKTYIIYIQS